MTILLSGGGTGGHITPLLAVAHELKHLQPNVNLVYVGERSGRFKQLTREHPDLDRSTYIFAGKFRRYHGESWLLRLFDVKTNLLNLRDIFFVFVGFLQALWLLITKRPDVIFIKGGFVGVPVGLAAAICRIPYITHDSDTTPGLANRIIGRWARLHATGMPIEFYSYPPEKTRFTGIPLAEEFKPETLEEKKAARKRLGLPETSEIVLITGGSLGSQRINKIVKEITPNLLNHRDNLYIIHQTGQGNETLYGDYRHSRLKVETFIEKFYEVSMAADVIVTRGSATTIAGLGIQAKPIVVIPSPFLAGGHQLKNAEHLQEEKAAVVLSEKELLDQPVLLQEALIRLLDDPQEQDRLSRSLAKLSKADASKTLAQLLLETKK